MAHAFDPCHVELVVRWDAGPLTRSRIGIDSVRALDTSRRCDDCGAPAREPECDVSLAYCDQCLTGPCLRCGQAMMSGTGVCDPCRELERRPQGEQPRLFSPAPTPLAGQLEL